MKISQRSMRMTRRSVAWTVVAAALLLLLLAAPAAQATVTTDQADYAPGSVVTILGNNVGLTDPWMPGSTVTVQVVGPYGYQFDSLTTTVDTLGGWSCWFTLSDNPLVAVGEYTYTASAAGSFETQSGTFSDGSVSLTVNADPAAAEGGSFTITSFKKNKATDWGPETYDTNPPWTTPSNRKVQSDGSFTITGISTDVDAYSYVGWTYNGVPHDASVAIDHEPNAGSDSTLTLRYDRLPALTAIPDQTTPWGSQLTFAASATDADGDPLTFGLSGQPSGASITSGGVFTWTPTKAQLAGSPHSFSVTVNDTKATVSTPVKVTVTKRSLTVTAVGVDKSYDGGTAAAVTLSDNRLSGDALTLAYASATFADKHVGNVKTISVSGLSITGGGDAGYYTLANVTASTTANITPADLDIYAVSDSKTYDGTTSSGGTPTVSGLKTGDSGTGLAQVFDSKDVGARTLSVIGGYTLNDGNSGGNYNVATHTAGGTITPAILTGHFTADNKPYDGTATAAILTRTLTGGIVGSEVVSLSGGSATFATAAVGTGKTVTGSGFTLTGADAGNYDLASTTLTTTADITPAILTGHFTADNKPYDGTATAAILTRTLTGGIVGSEVVSLSGGSATFATAAVGTGKTVTGSGFTLTGADAGNYDLASTTLTTTADITARDLTVTASGVNRPYDGTIGAAVTLSSDEVPGDALTLAYTSASFADKNVGTWTVSVSGISISGTNAANYHLLNTTADTTASITPKNLDITAKNQSKFFGALFTFAGTDFTAVGLLSSDSVASVTMTSNGAAASAPVGTYDIVPSAAIGLGLGNYNITYANGTLTVIYGWSGILQPINSDGSSIFKQGSTIPVKFKLTGSSAGIANANATIKITKIGAGVTGTDLETLNSNPASTGNAFRYDGSSDQYIYNWGTKNVTQGTYRIDIMLGDGVVHSVVVSLRK